VAKLSAILLGVALVATAGCPRRTGTDCTGGHREAVELGSPIEKDFEPLVADCRAGKRTGPACMPLCEALLRRRNGGDGKGITECAMDEEPGKPPLVTVNYTWGAICR
jgi:hypothetical protein